MTCHCCGKPMHFDRMSATMVCAKAPCLNTGVHYRLPRKDRSPIPDKRK